MRLEPVVRLGAVRVTGYAGFPAQPGRYAGETHRGDPLVRHVGADPPAGADGARFQTLMIMCRERRTEKGEVTRQRLCSM